MSTIDRCPAHLFNLTGKWKYEVFLDYTGMVEWDERGDTKLVGPGGRFLNAGDAARDALRQATANGTSGVTISELGLYTLVVIEPPNGFPVMVRGAES